MDTQITIPCGAKRVTCRLKYTLSMASRADELAKAQAIQIADFDYALPDNRIAQQPVLPRENALLLTLQHGQMVDRTFGDLPDLLPKNSTLVLNDTKVVHARLHLQRTTGGHFEALLLHPVNPNNYQASLLRTDKCVWKCLLGHAHRWKNDPAHPANDLQGAFTAMRLPGHFGANTEVEFSWTSGLPFSEELVHWGAMPIPPYLKREAKEEDSSWYQTVYAQHNGSVAAPTAGLHLSEEMMTKIQANHQLLRCTLHVGAGTFLPVKSTTMADHHMHRERIIVTKQLLEGLLQSQGPTIAIGTTSLRLLESIYCLGCLIAHGHSIPTFPLVEQWGGFAEYCNLTRTQSIAALLQRMASEDTTILEAETEFIITPPYTPKMAQGLITNFHQPKSTLLLLVAACIGDQWRTLYQHALQGNYRFLSYGDGMLLLFNE